MSGHWLTLHESVDPSWWQPLERLATKLRDRPDLPPVNLDDFLYCARVRVSDNLPMLNVYRNVLSQRYLNVDDMAHTWRYTGGSPGYAMCEVDEALQRADLERAELLAGRTRRGRRRPGLVAAAAPPQAAAGLEAAAVPGWTGPDEVRAGIGVTVADLTGDREFGDHGDAGIGDETDDNDDTDDIGETDDDEDGAEADELEDAAV